jgi:hypothetical protein
MILNAHTNPCINHQSRSEQNELGGIEPPCTRADVSNVEIREFRGVEWRHASSGA